MKKETIIATIFGIALGGAVAVFIIFKSKDIELSKNKVIAPKETVSEKTVTDSNSSFQSLEIDSPTDGSVVDTNTITIKGRVEKESLLVIQSPIKDLVVKTDSNTFSLDFPLALGENTIKVVAYPKNQTLRQQEKNLKIYYLDSQI